MIKKTIWTLLALTAAILPSAPVANAAAILNFSLMPSGAATPGNSVNFTATVTAPNTNAGTIFLNSDSFTIDSPLTLNDTPFILNFPLFLNPGDTFTGVLFTVDIPVSAATKVYNGAFALLGGTDASALSNITGNVSFTVAATPEPTTWLLVGCSILGLVAFRRKLSEQR